MMPCGVSGTKSMVVCRAWQEGAGSHRQIQCALFCKVRSQGQPEGQRRIQCAAAGTTEREGDVETLAGCWKDGLGPAFQLEGERGAHTDCLGRLRSLPFVSRSHRHLAGMACTLGGSLN